jgi:ornithine carbamoyltransferase
VIPNTQSKGDTVSKRDFLTITDFTRAELDATLQLAQAMKKKRFEYKPFAGGAAALIFKKPSLRTRVSFEVGVHELGGHPIYITDQEIGLGKRESVYDIAQVLSRFVKLIEIRTFEHSEVEDLARNASVPVVNGLTDSFHPCQVIGDILTVVEHKGKIDGLTVAYLGDGNNVSHSWLRAAERFDFNLRIGTATETQPNEAIFKQAQKNAKGKVEIVHNAIEAVRGADVLYTDVWASMGQKHLADEKKARLQSFQINSALMKHAAENAIVLHCLPANRGEEITDEVMDGPQSVVFDEAENRLHAQKAIMHQVLTATGA